MIYTLNILTELIIRDLSGGDIPNDSPYSWDAVTAHVRNALREDLKLELLQRRAGREDDRTPVTQYIATYKDVEVQVEQETYRVFIDLPSSYMSLKHNKGIHAISPMKSPNAWMIPVANPGVTAHLQHADFERDNYGYYVEGQKVFFMRDIIKDNIKKVLLKLIVPAPDTIGADDPLPVIPENVARIIDMVKNRILNKNVNDRLNDGNPNLRPQNV
jgi:hypothetical protein